MARLTRDQLRAIATHQPGPGASAPAVSALPAQPRGGRRKVLYLHDDVIALLEQLQRQADDQGLRLTQSAIVDYAVRNLEA